MGLKILPLEKVRVLVALYTSISDMAVRMKKIAQRVLSPCKENIFLSEALSLGMVIYFPFFLH